MLALRLGCTVEELLHRVSSAELTEWQAYFILERGPQAPQATDTKALREMLAQGVRKKPKGK